jgi:cell division protein ZipA
MSTLRLWLLGIGVAIILIYYFWATLKLRKEKSRYKKWGGADDTPLVRPPPVNRQKPPHPKPLEVTATQDLSAFETETLKNISQLISAEDPHADVAPAVADEMTPSTPTEMPVASKPAAAAPPPSDVGLKLDPDSDVAAEQVIALHMVAKDVSGFSSKKLFSVLEKEGLIFGSMNIFHMLIDEKGLNHDLFSDKDVIFSVANMHEPGVFDRDAPVSELLTGIVLFMVLPCAVDAVDGYDIMLNTANTLAKKLDGKVLDGHRSVLTAQAIQSQRDRLRVQALKASSQ